jgi:hypothetical protein
VRDLRASTARDGRACLFTVSIIDACIEGGRRTFMVGIEYVLVGVTECKLVGDGWLPAAVGWSSVVRIVCRHRLKKLALCLWCPACPRVSLFPTASFREPHLAQASSFPAIAFRSICCPAWASRSLPFLHPGCPAVHGRPVCVWGSWGFGVRLPLRRCCGAPNERMTRSFKVGDAMGARVGGMGGKQGSATRRAVDGWQRWYCGCLCLGACVRSFCAGVPSVALRACPAKACFKKLRTHLRMNTTPPQPAHSTRHSADPPRRLQSFGHEITR